MNEIRDAIVSAIALLRVLRTVQIASGDKESDSEIQADIASTEEQLSIALRLIGDIQNDSRNN
jgi:hypothetical protein